MAEHFDEVAVTRCALVCDDHSVMGLLFLAGAS
jgi:hypothetical protein